MKITTLDDVYKAVIGEQGESIVLDEEIRKKALKSIDKMLELG
jgi:quinolinate synthase